MLGEGTKLNFGSTSDSGVGTYFVKYLEVYLLFGCIGPTYNWNRDSASARRRLRCTAKDLFSGGLAKWKQQCTSNPSKTYT